MGVSGTLQSLTTSHYSAIEADFLLRVSCSTIGLAVGPLHRPISTAKQAALGRTLASCSLLQRGYANEP